MGSGWTETPSNINYLDERKELLGMGLKRIANLFISTTDQACTEADPCRSAYPLQGHRRHW